MYVFIVFVSSMLVSIPMVWSNCFKWIEKKYFMFKSLCVCSVCCMRVYLCVCVRAWTINIHKILNNWSFSHSWLACRMKSNARYITFNMMYEWTHENVLMSVFYWFLFFISINMEMNRDYVTMANVRTTNSVYVQFFHYIPHIRH